MRVEGGKHLWLVGLALGTMACGCNALGMVLQRKAHQDAKRWLTWAGVSSMALAGLLDFASFAFAAQSLIAPLGSLTLVANALIARAVLGERLMPLGWVATVVVVAGCAATVAGASHDSKVHSAEEFVAFLGSPVVLAYFGSVAGVLAICITTLLGLEQAYPSLTASPPMAASDQVSLKSGLDTTDACAPCCSCVEHSSELVLDCVAMHGDPASSLPEPGAQEGAAPGVLSLSCSPCSSGAGATPLCRQLHGVLHGIVGGVVGAQSLAFGKASAEMAMHAVHGEGPEPFNPLVFCLALGLMVFTLVSQLFALNRALRFHPTLLVVPVYQTFWTLAGVLGGAVCFNEFASASPAALVLFGVGGATMLGGLFCLVRAQEKPEEAEEAEEAGLGLPFPAPKKELELFGKCSFVAQLDGGASSPTVTGVGGGGGTGQVMGTGSGNGGLVLIV